MPPSDLCSSLTSGPRCFWEYKAAHVVLAVVIGLVIALSGCTSNSDDPLAVYTGERPLSITRVTQSYTPDIQWLGGRVAAVGVNRDTVAGLNSTLIWMRVAQGNEINSYATFGEFGDTALVRSFGGTPITSLINNRSYTFWIADDSLFRANLDTLKRTPYNFASATVGLRLYLSGTAGGYRLQNKLVTTLRVRQDERLLRTRYYIEWTPDTMKFRRIGINYGTQGSFSDLLWHVVLPDTIPDSFLSPVTIGIPPANAFVVDAIDPPGITSGENFFIWCANKSWALGVFDDRFGYRGLATFRINK